MQGGTPSTKAQSYFSSSKFRENAYEATFNKNAKGTTPTKVEEKKEGGLGGILGLVSSLFGGLATKLLSFGSIVAGLVGTLAALGTLLMGTVKLIMSVVSMLPGGKLLIKGLKLGALAAGGLFAANALSESGNGNSQGSNIGNTLAGTAAGIGGALAVGSAVSAGSKLVTAGKATAGAISNAKVASNPYVQMSGGATDPKSKWGKFLKFLERKSPKLFAKFGARLATAGILATIPVVGWVAALLQLGLSIALAYEIYNLWREFTNDKDLQKENNSSSSTPEDMSFDDALIGAFAEALGLNQPTSPTPATPSLPKAGTAEAVSQQSFLGGQQQTYASMGGGEFGPDMLAATGVNVDQVNNTSPTRAGGGDMANLIRTKFKAAGFSDAQAEGAVANAIAESRLDPNAYNGRGGEESVGLFQMNRKGGLGKDYSVEQLKDPNLNIDLAIAAAKKAPRFQAAKTAEEATKAFMLEVERPKDQSASAQAKRVGFLNKTGEKIGEASSAAAAANRTPASSSGGNQTINNIGGGSGNQSVALGSAASPYDTELARFLTGMMATK
jgi:hypothetical protein